MPVPSTDRLLDALVVASWFPACDDATKGRFVADQVEALLATGRVRPSVASFELIGLTGGVPDRRRQVRAIQANTDRVIRDDVGLFNARGSHSPAGIPVARLPIAGGGPGVDGTAHGSLRRDHALRLLADRRDRPAWSVIHAHTGYPDGAGAVGLAGTLGLPLVITEHATFVDRLLADADQRRAYVAGVRAAARVVAVSRSLADELVAAIPEIEPKLVVIPNTVDVDGFTGGPLGDRRPEELLFIGYRTLTKGIDVLLAAFREVLAARPGATLRLIGRSPDDETESGWERLAAQLGVTGSVTFEPPALRTEVARAMARASLLVHASRRETFGVAPVEALASGLPVIATDIGPLREILGDEPRPLGALVPVGDPHAFAAAILDALDRRASFDPAALRTSVVDRFGSRSVANRLADLYQEVAEGAGTGSRPAGHVRPQEPPSTATQPDTPDALAAAAVITPAPAEGGPTILVIGYTTARTARLLQGLPEQLRLRCRLVTSQGAGIADLPPGLGGCVAVDLDGPYRQTAPSTGTGAARGTLRARLLRALRDPTAVVTRRWVRGRRERHRAAAAQEALAVQLEAIRASTSERPLEVVGLDGLDHVALQPLLADDLRLIPGSVRWLADRAASGGV